MESVQQINPRKIGRQQTSQCQLVSKRQKVQVMVQDFSPIKSKLQYLLEYCRVCAMRSKVLIPIYEEPGIEMQLEEKINKYLPITVSENDTLPLKVCNNCIEKIEITHELILSSLDSDIKFKFINVQNH